MLKLKNFEYWMLFHAISDFWIFRSAKFSVITWVTFGLFNIKKIMFCKTFSDVCENTRILSHTQSSSENNILNI